LTPTSKIQGKKHAIDSAYRTDRTFMGWKKGMPCQATMKPVLQISATKAALP
jgi:hypothetical protein